MRFEQSRNAGSALADLKVVASQAKRALLCVVTLLPTVLLWGCASGQNSTAPQVSPQTYSISGTISPVMGGSGATVTLSGTASATTTANSSGSYTFTGLANGAYTVTPSNTGYTFGPVNQAVTVNGASVTGVNFTATAQQAHSVALTWDASTSTVSGYNVYRSTVSGTGYTKINSALVPTLAYTDATVVSGTTYYYVATAVDSSGNESVYSNEVSAPVP
jgi:carboxypeptidase family protein